MDGTSNEATYEFLDVAAVKRFSDSVYISNINPNQYYVCGEYVNWMTEPFNVYLRTDGTLSRTCGDIGFFETKEKAEYFLSKFMEVKLRGHIVFKKDGKIIKEFEYASA